MSTAAFRFAVNVLPKTGILDPQGRAVEGSLPHLGVSGVTGVRVGRRVELSVDAATESEARATVEHLAEELLSNPLIESFAIELLEATSSTRSPGGAGTEASAAGAADPTDGVRA